LESNVDRMKLELPVSIVVSLSLSACAHAPDATSSIEEQPQSIAFVSDKETRVCRQIFTMKLDGSRQTRITHSTIDFIDPVFSPDGAKILATSYTRDSSDEIYMMNTDGSQCVNVSNAPGDDHFASFSPDGRSIVFSSSRDGNPEIYVMDSQGQHQTRLTHNEMIDHSPQYTPDGSRIVYCSSVADESGQFSYDIHIMNADGSHAVCLTAGASYHVYPPFLQQWNVSVHDLAPGFSSDGSRIVFTSYLVGSFIDQEMYVMDLDGGNFRLIAAGEILAPLFTPDNSRIVFRSHRDGKFDLYEIGLDGENLRKLTVGTPGHVFFSQFSQDGNRILFYTEVGSYPVGAFEKIWTMNRDGSGQSQLTFGEGNDTYPRFRPFN
jgi:Tol biopolymer transport system component